MNALKLRAVNTLKWSALSFGFTVFFVFSLVVTGWVSFQLLVFLMQH